MLLTAILLSLPQEVAWGETAPKPRLRPPADATAPAAPAAVPVPKPRPAPTGPQEEAKPVAPPAPERDWSAAEIEDARGTCRRLLDGLDIEHAPVDPIGKPGACGAPAPVVVSQVAGVAVTPAATLTCEMAAALHNWVSGSLKPAARRHLKTEVTAINAAASYVCRRRNNSSMGKISEHGRANALDMSGSAFAETGKGVAVGFGDWGDGILASLGIGGKGSFLEEIRKAACSHFTTVLGPGSDPYHGDHFHVDALSRKGDYRICQ